MGRLCISLFGKFLVHYGHENPIELESLKVQELFGYLLLFRDRSHTREKLADILWANSSTTQSKQYLRQALWQLQSSLDRASETDQKILLAEAEWIRTSASADIWLDVTEFEQAFYLSRGIRGRELDAPKAKALQDAIPLYKGDLLENWYQDWCIIERERFQNMYLDMLHKLMAYCETSRKFEEGLHYGSLILRCDPSREKAHRRIMRLRYLIGDRTGALRQYERCRQILGEELGVEPSQRTKDLHRMVQADAIPSAEAPPADAQSQGRISAISLSNILNRLNQLTLTLKDAQCQLEQEIADVTSLLHNHH